MKNLLSMLLTGILISAMPWASADILLIDVIDSSPPNGAGGIPRPIRGQKMDQVRRQFGEPVSVLAPVGEPPITRWIYDRYTVYFEFETVLQSVINRPDR